ncbi:MAG: carbohydrate-binding protein [Kiritimatiellaeota bacterium]|nr:carbohydrate-binding protein [Kiritimatiellota bacterium]
MLTRLRLSVFLLLSVSVLPVRIGTAAEDLTELGARAARWEFGQDRSELSRLEKAFYAATPPERKAIERLLLGVLADSRSTYAGKQAICRMLRRAGSAQAVPVLKQSLADPELCHMALRALAAIPGSAATKALRERAGIEKQPYRAEVVATLGARRDRGAVDLLARLAAESNRAVAEAALGALGRIGTEDAARSLDDLHPGKPLLAAWCDAYLACAQVLRQEKRPAAAERIYVRLCRPEHPMPVRAAALRGLAALGGDRAVATVLAFLTSSRPSLRRAAAAAAVRLPGANATRALARMLPDLAPQAQLPLVRALGLRADAAAAPAVLALANQSSADVQEAAVRALGTVGDAKAVVALCQWAAGRGRLATTAFKSLCRLGGPELDAVLLDRARNAAPDLRAVCIRALAARGSRGAVPALLSMARPPGDTNVRREALKALATLGGPEHLGDILNLLPRAGTESERGAIRKAAVALLAKYDDRTRALPTLLPRLRAAESAVVRASLVRLLGSVGGHDALAAVRTALSDSDAAVRDAALRTLASWSDPAAIEDLLRAAAETDSTVHRVLALRGCARLLEILNRQSPGTAAEFYRKALALSGRLEEKKTLVGSLGAASSPEALALAASFVADHDLGPEAIAACKRIMASMDKAALTAATPTLERLAGQGANSELAAAIREALSRARSNRYEAENAVLTGAVIERIHGGASGKAYVNFIQRAGAVIEWRLAVARTGRYSIAFRYALSGTASRSLRIELDGRPVANRLAFKGTRAWTRWTTTRIAVLSLERGGHKLRAVTLGGDGPNIDYLQIKPET